MTSVGLPSTEKPWLKYYSEDAINAVIPECTVYENIRQHNKERPDDIALVYFGRKITYRDMFLKTETCVSALRQAGVQAGERITLCTSGVPEAAYLVLACSKIGATANFINPIFTTSQMIDRINETGSRTLFVLDVMYEYIADAIDGTCIQEIVILSALESLPNTKRAGAKLFRKPDKRLGQAMRAENCKTWRAWIKAGKEYTGAPTETYRANTPVVMVYSSGTTGASKGIQLTNDGINATIAQYEYGFSEVQRQRSFLHIIPIWFSSGVSISLLMPLCLGVTCIMEPIFDFKSFVRDVKIYKPSYAFATTSFWLYLLDHIGPHHKLSHFLCPMTGGEPLLPSAEQAINRFLEAHGCIDSLQKGWGLCELGATAVASSASPSQAGARNRIGSAGLPLPQVTIGVFDMEDDRELPCGQHGELRVLTPCRMLGYYNNPVATGEFFREGMDGNLWGCTGDIGYMDEDGFVYILGRTSDSFLTTNGKRIYLFDVENVILQDRAVEMCEVVETQSGGRTIAVAHIVLRKENMDDARAVIRRIDKLCQSSLPQDAVPVFYKTRDGFAIKRFGKRDTEALKSERTGFVDAAGMSVLLPD